MAQKDYAEILCQAVDEIVTKKLEGVKFDKTINCTIINDSEAASGKYKVTDGSAKFYAYSVSTDYKENDAVYVTVPNGDYNNQKIIIGKQVSNNTSPFIFTTPFDTIVDVSTNLINDKTTSGYLRANDPTETQVLLWEKDFTTNNQDIAGFTRLGLQGQFRSWLDSFKCVSGNYGYKLILHCKEEVVKTEENNYDLAIKKLEELVNDGQEYFDIDIRNYIEISCNIKTIPWEDYYEEGYNYKIADILPILQEQRIELSYAKYELFLSSSEDMYGNPYNFESYYQQEKVFDISAIKEIQRMELYFYQEAASFIDKNGELVPYNDNFGNPLLPNLFTKDAYICLGYDVATFDNDQANIYCLDSNTYSDHYLLEDNKKHIILRWIHQFEDGRVKTVPDTTDLLYEIRWYKYKLGAPSADEYSGVYWERIKNESNFYYTLDPDVKKEIEQIKAIILYNDKVIRSNIITFTNEKEVINEATSNFLAGLNIWCKDNTYGNYYIYDPGNKILEQYDVKQARELVALFSTQSNLMTSESEGSLLTEAKSITWTFPTVSTMLTVYNIDYSVPYLDKDNSQFAVCAPQGMTAANAIDKTFQDGNLHTLIYELEDKTQVVYDHIAKTIEITRYGDINNAEAIDASQLYFIKKDYIQSYTNNVIQCSIIKNHTEYFTSKTFYFGQAGTTGTDTTLKIYIDPADKFALTKQDGGDTLHLRAMLFDSHNKEIDPNDESNYANVQYEWSWLNYKYDYEETLAVQIEPFIGGQNSTVPETDANQIIKNKQWLYDTDKEEYIFQDKTTYYNNTARNEIILSASENLTMNHFLILQCTVKGWGDYDLTAYKPIAIRLGEIYSFVDCANEVIYLTSGYPEYYKEAWKIHLENIDEDNDGHEDEYTKGQWKIFNPYNEDLNYIGEFSNKNVLKPVGIYMENVNQYGAQYYDENGNIVWTQPIICLTNNYPSGTLNKWTGKEIEITDEGQILAPAIAAGKKNSDDNTFSGVMFGDWSSDPNGVNAFIGNQTGIYGFNHGMISYAFMEDGTAFIGKAGKGRILFDGNESTISSENYKKNLGGLLIDLDDGYIDIRDNANKTRFWASAGSVKEQEKPWLEITGDIQELLHISKTACYLQSDDYYYSSWYGGSGMKIDLDNGSITSAIFKLEAGYGGRKIIIDSTAIGEFDYSYDWGYDKNGNWYFNVVTTEVSKGYPFIIYGPEGRFSIDWNGGVFADYGVIGGFAISKQSIFGSLISDNTNLYNLTATQVNNTNVFNSYTYWGKSAKKENTYDFRLGNSLIYQGNRTGGNSKGRLYLASNLYSIRGASEDITSENQLNNNSYFIYGINSSNNLQIGSAALDSTYGDVNIYAGKESTSENDGDSVEKAIRLIPNGTSAADFRLKITDTTLKIKGIKSENQYGIYARFG